MPKTWKEEYEEKQAKIRQLALLCLETRELTTDELVEISAHSDELYSYFERRQFFAWHDAGQLLRARTRRAELDKLSTDELELRMHSINLGRQAFLSSLSSRDEDELGDSTFEGSSIDSDKCIVHQLLEDRWLKAATT